MYRGTNIDVVIPIAISKWIDTVKVVPFCSDGASQSRVRLDEIYKSAEWNAFAV